MAQYRIATPQGSAVVEAPEGATKAEVIELYNRTMAYDGTKTARQESAATRGYLDAQAEQARQTALSREAGVLDYLGEVPKGLIGGAANLVEQGAVGLAALLPEGAEDVVRGGIKAVGGAVQDYVSPDIGIGDSIPRKLSEGVGSFVGLAGVSMLNPYAGAALAVSAGAGEASERARAAGATEDERSLAALAGIFPGALELLPIKFLQVLGKDGVRSILNTTARVLTEGGVEAAQETTTAIIQNLIAQGIYKPDQKLIEGVGEQAALGGTVGAIVQGLIELATPRTRGGTGTAVDAGPQGELFSGEDLGRAPQRQEPTPDQAEMFPTEDLGQAPEGPDPRQGDLFAAPEETLARRAKELEREKEAVMRRPMGEAIAEFEAKDDKFFERNKRERDAARAGIASLEAAKRRPETTTRDMRDMVAESQDQVADEQARDREGLAAAERGDVAAFEQPDLFAQELESEQRRLGPKELRDPEQYMDATLFEETETPEFVRPAAERDLVDLINQDKAREDNAAVRSGKLAAQEADLAGRTQDQTRLKAESAAETAQGTIEARRTAQTTATRTKVLQDTIANAGEIRKPEALRNLYETALKGAGVANAKATPQEMESLRRASSVIRATDPALDAVVAQETVKDPGQVDMEARVAPKDRKSVPLAPLNKAVITADMLPQPLGKGRPDAASGTERATPIEDGRGASVEGAIQGSAEASSDGASAGQDTQETPTPDAGPVGQPVSSTADAPAGTVAQPSTLEPKGERPRVIKDSERGYNIETRVTGKGDDQVAKVYSNNEYVGDLIRSNAYRSEAMGWAKDLTDTSWVNPKDSLREAARRLVGTKAAEKRKATKIAPGEADVTPTTKQTTQKATPTPGAAEATSPSVKQTTQKAKPTPGPAKSKPEGKPVATKTNADLVVEAVAEYRKIKSPTGNQAAAFVSRLKVLGIDNPPAFLANLQKRKEQEQLKLPADLTLEFPVDTSVSAAVESGDLKGALEALATTAPDAKVQRIAKKLASNVGNTQLVTKKNLKADDGSAVAGYFDPETNTIFLDAETGISTHPILHEVLHAVTSATVANKSHPLTKKLTRIFEGVQEQLAGEYGLTSLDEFVAEAMSNPEFQTQLKTTTVNGRNPWQQLVRAVSNYVRRMLGLETKPEGSTLDAVDEIVQAMIAPTFDGRIATKIYMQIKTPAGAGKLINGMAANVVNVVKEKGWYEAARDWVGGATPPKAKSVFLDFMELRILSELASKKIPEALKLNDLVNNMSDNLKVENKRLRPIIADLTNLMAKNKKDFATLRFLLPNSSAERIDPRVKDFDKAYGRDKGDVDAVKLAKVIHKDLHAEWNSMGAEGKRLYSTVTNMFESRFDDAMDSIKENIRVMFGEDAAKAEATIKNLAEKLGIDRGRIRPYMPLGRDGNYRLEFNTLDPRTKRPEQFVEYYATAKLRNKAKDNIKAYEDKLRAELPKGDVGLEFLGQTPLEGMRDSTSNFDKAPQGSFVANVLNTLKADGVDSASINSIIELAIDSMPERSFMQAFRTRKDTRGFLGDVTPTGMAQEAFDLIDTVQSKGRDYNRQVVQMQFGAKIQTLKNEINEKYKYKDIDESTSLFKKKLLKIADFAQAPNVSRLSQNITGAAYAWTMGLNLSSAATAVFDVPMSVYPRLAGKFGDKDAVYALAAAVRMLSNSPKESITETYGAEIDPATGKPIMVKRKINEGFAGYSNTNYDFDEIRAMSKAEMDKAGMSQKERQEILDTEVLVEVGSRSAQYNSSLNHEHLDVTRGKDQANFLGLKINMETVNAFSSFLFHHSERYSREVTMQAAYRLELNRLRDKPNNTEKKLSDLEKKYIAAEYAVSETQLSLGATASAGRPIISQNAIGNVAMLFKRFAISKYYMMARMTDEAFKNAKTADEKAMRSMARGQLGRFMVTSAAFAGVAGMPLMGAIGQIYDLFADEEDDTFDAVLLKTFGEPFSSGLINAALGVDMASRINMNSLLYRPPIIEKDQPAAYTLLEQLGGPAVGIYLSFDRGYDLFNEGEFVKGTEAILPAAFRNVLKGVQQLYTGEVATRRGNAVVEDIGLGQILAQFAGFANADVIRQYAINKNERRKDTYLTTTRTLLLRAANIAAAERDTDGYKDAMKRIREYNKNLPPASRSKLIILPETIEKSRTSFNTRTSNMIGGIEYTPQMRQSLKEYDQGLFD
jgi:hypothetical protein